MGISKSFTLIFSIVMLSLIVIGIIIILIMKKVKAPEKVRTITSISVAFVGLIFAGYLVYDVSMGMMYNLAETKSYREYTVENDAKTQSLIIKEYNSINATGFEIYADNEKLGDVSTDKYLPFGNGEYKLEWKDDSAKLYYTFKRLDNEYICKYCTVDLKSKSVSESADSELVLLPTSEQSSSDKISQKKIN